MKINTIIAAAGPASPYEWEATALLLDTPTDDGRVIESAGFSWRDTPLALTYAPQLSEGHDGAYQVGTILDISVSGNKVMARGNYLDSPEAQEFAALIADPDNAISVSVDLAIQKAVQTILSGDEGWMPVMAAPDPAPVEDAPDPATEEQPTTEEPETMEVPVIDTENEVLHVQQSKMIGLTALVQPAFDKPVGITNLSWVADPIVAAAGDNMGMICLYPDTPDDLAQPGGEAAADLHLTLCVLDVGAEPTDLDAALTALAADTGTISGLVNGVLVFSENGSGYPVCAEIDADGACDLRENVADILGDLGIPYKDDYDAWVPHICLAYESAAPTALPTDLLAKPVSFSVLSYTNGSDRTDYPLSGAIQPADAMPDADEAIAASAEPITAAAPVAPPREWFTDPALSEPTALHIGEDGRVYGHLAYWGECHTGHMGRCVEPPTNPSGEYPWFNLGELKTEEGDLVTVGQLTLDADHAELPMSLRAASNHYAHTALAVADVHAGEDEHGIWVAGAMRPDADEEKERVLRASKLSGDWRPTEDGLELIAALATNVPGYPVPRALLAAGSSGEPEVVALVAAGAVPPHLRAVGEPSAEDAARRMRVLGARAHGMQGLAALAHG